MRPGRYDVGGGAVSAGARAAPAHRPSPPPPEQEQIRTRQRRLSACESVREAASNRDRCTRISGTTPDELAHIECTNRARNGAPVIRVPHARALIPTRIPGPVRRWGRPAPAAPRVATGPFMASEGAGGVPCSSYGPSSIESHVLAAPHRSGSAHCTRAHTAPRPSQRSAASAATPGRALQPPVSSGSCSRSVTSEERRSSSPVNSNVLTFQGNVPSSVQVAKLFIQLNMALCPFDSCS